MTDQRRRGAGRSRRLSTPRAAAVRAGADGVPLALDAGSVDTVCEEWVVEDLWWTGRPLRRRYFELVLDDGRNTVVFHDLIGRGWFAQRG